MTHEETEKAYKLRWRIIREQGYKCKGIKDGKICNKIFTPGNPPEIAHRIPKHKKWLERYGEDVINHRLNLRATCKNCNSSVLINPWTLPGQRLIKEIQEAINADSD